MRKYLLLIFLLFCCSKANGQITAAGCDSTSVQNAFNAVVAGTTTVTIPTCTGGSIGTWTTTVTLTVPSGNTNLTVQGSSTTSGTCAPGGTCTPTDNTIIVDNLTRGGGGCGTDPAFLQINTAAASSKFRLTGITFNFTGQQTCSGSIRVAGNSQNIRIDHNHFNQQFSTGIGMSGWTLGVIDHNFFEAPSGVWNAIKFEETTWNNDPLNAGDQSWATATQFGTNQFMYVENNEFHSTFNGAVSYANDCTSGGRYVWRYNLELNTNHQTHPTGGGQRHRGCRAVEIYNNSDTGTGGVGANFNFFFLSSGPSLIWGNTVDNTFSNFVTIHSMRRDNSTYGQAATPNGWGYCGTSFDGTGSGWDQNTNASTGYRCLDQPGQGVGQALKNDFPNTLNSVTNTIAWPNEALEPVYEWLNTSSSTTFLSNYETDALFANSDYYLHAASFNGTSGTGSGLLSARPATCSVKVAYWATDTNTLYTCNTTNTWTAYYTPFTYPHPLVSGASATPGFVSEAGKNSTLSVALGANGAGTISSSTCANFSYCLPFAENSLVGNLGIVSFQYANGAAVTSTVTDDAPGGSNVWTCIGSSAASSGKFLNLCYAPNLKANTHKVTIGFAGTAVSQVQADVAQFFNINQSAAPAPLRTSATVVGVSSTTMTGPALTTTAGDLVYALFCRTGTPIMTSGSFTPGSGFTLGLTKYQDGCATEFMVSPGGTITPTMTTGSASTYVVFATDFVPSAIAAGTAPTVPYLQRVMSWSSQSGISTASTKFQLPNSANDLIVMTGDGATNYLANTITDSGSNVWTLAGQCQQNNTAAGNCTNSGGFSYEFYKTGAAVNSTNTQTVNFTGSGDTTVFFYDFVGTFAFGTRNQFSSNAATGNGGPLPATAFSFTPGATTNLVIAVGPIAFNTALSVIQPSTSATNYFDGGFFGGESIDGGGVPESVIDQNNIYSHTYTSTAGAKNWSWGGDVHASANNVGADLISFSFGAGAVAPTVTTTTATSITTTTATSGGTVTSNGGASVTSEGVCYATTANPTSPCTSNGTATPFTSAISSLTPNTLYNYRAFATNLAGTGFGSNLTFTTQANPLVVTVTTDGAGASHSGTAITTALSYGTPTGGCTTGGATNICYFGSTITITGSLCSSGTPCSWTLKDQNNTVVETVNTTAQQGQVSPLGQIDCTGSSANTVCLYNAPVDYPSTQLVTIGVTDGTTSGTVTVTFAYLNNLNEYFTHRGRAISNPCIANTCATPAINNLPWNVYAKATTPITYQPLIITFENTVVPTLEASILSMSDDIGYGILMPSTFGSGINRPTTSYNGKWIEWTWDTSFPGGGSTTGKGVFQRTDGSLTQIQTCFVPGKNPMPEKNRPNWFITNDGTFLQVCDVDNAQTITNIQTHNLPTQGSLIPVGFSYQGGINDSVYGLRSQAPNPTTCPSGSITVGCSITFAAFDLTNCYTTISATCASPVGSSWSSFVNGTGIGGPPGVGTNPLYGWQANGAIHCSNPVLPSTDIPAPNCEWHLHDAWYIPKTNNITISYGSFGGAGEAITYYMPSGGGAFDSSLCATPPTWPNLTTVTCFTPNTANNLPFFSHPAMVQALNYLITYAGTKDCTPSGHTCTNVLLGNSLIDLRTNTSVFFNTNNYDHAAWDGYDTNHFGHDTTLGNSGDLTFGCNTQTLREVNISTAVDTPLAYFGCRPNNAGGQGAGSDTLSPAQSSDATKLYYSMGTSQKTGVIGTSQNIGSFMELGWTFQTRRPAPPVNVTLNGSVSANIQWTGATLNREVMLYWLYRQPSCTGIWTRVASIVQANWLTTGYSPATQSFVDPSPPVSGANACYGLTSQEWAGSESSFLSNVIKVTNASGVFSFTNFAAQGTLFTIANPGNVTGLAIGQKLVCATNCASLNTPHAPTEAAGTGSVAAGTYFAMVVYGKCLDFPNCNNFQGTLPSLASSGLVLTGAAGSNAVRVIPFNSEMVGQDAIQLYLSTVASPASSFHLQTPTACVPTATILNSTVILLTNINQASSNNAVCFVGSYNASGAAPPVTNTAVGGYQLTWTDPGGVGNRYVQIYYREGGVVPISNETTAQQYLIATPPIGTQSFYDAFPNQNVAPANIHYAITTKNMDGTRSSGVCMTGAGVSESCASLPTVATPTFSPIPGVYSSNQTVTISSTTAGATFCSTVDGTTPTANGLGTCTHGATGSSVSITTTETLQAIGSEAGFADSAVASGVYTISSTIATPTFSPVAGAYTTTQSVTISTTTTPTPTFCYTLDNSTPTTNGSGTCINGTTYSGPVSISISETLKAIATESGFIDSAITSGNYTIGQTIATPTFSPVAGPYLTTQSVTISSTSSGVTFCYTTNGTTPSTNNAGSCTLSNPQTLTYSGPVSVAVSETITVIGTDSGFFNSATASASYIIGQTVASPIFNPSAGTYPVAQTVTITTTTPGATICYTNNGTTPTADGNGNCINGTRYTSSIPVPSTVTLTAIGDATGYTHSPPVVANYVITSTTVRAPGVTVFMHP